MKRENFVELPLRDQLLKKIDSYRTTIWNNKVDKNKLDAWLNNFKNESSEIEEKEKLNMLYLLSKFSYIGEKEVRILLKSLYRDLFKHPIIQKIRKESNDTLDLGIIDKGFKKALSITKFVAVGGVSESSAMLMYPFRQENSLAEEDMILQNGIFHKIELENGEYRKAIDNERIMRYIFVDDFIGSGAQGKDKLKEDISLLRELEKTSLEINYYVLVATEEGLNAIKGLKLFNSVEAVFILDDTFKTFEKSSRYYKNANPELDLNFSKKVVLKYGSTLFPRQELGFGDCQLLLGFSHNTPDNTLPIFWSEESHWNWIFKRFAKK